MRNEEIEVMRLVQNNMYTCVYIYSVSSDFLKCVKWNFEVLSVNVILNYWVTCTVYAVRMKLLLHSVL